MSQLVLAALLAVILRFFDYQSACSDPGLIAAS
jgi:hypothetical protein